MIEKKFTIMNKLGLHARAAAKFVALASRFSSSIYIIKQEKRHNAKSIMAVMMLAIRFGQEIELVFDGEDENEAAFALGQLILERFGESE